MKTKMMFIVAWMIASVVFAQRGGRHSHSVGDAQAEKMKTELGLNDAQYASIKTINKKYVEKRVALRNDSTALREEKMAAFKTLRTERENEIQSVLTSEQKKKWESYKAQRAANRKQKMEARLAERETKMKRELALNEDQFARLQQENKAFRAKIKSFRENNKTRKSNTDEIAKLKTEHQGAVKAILSKEQFAKWEGQRRVKKNRHRR